MKKVLSIAIMLLMVISVSAQKRVIDRNLTLNGPLEAYTKSEKVTGENIIKCEKGTEWYLENKRIGEENHVTFWIQTPDGNKHEMQYWHGHETEIMMMNEDGTKFFYVYDDTFIYVGLTQIKGGGYILRLCTKER